MLSFLKVEWNMLTEFSKIYVCIYKYLITDFLICVSRGYRAYRTIAKVIL